MIFANNTAFRFLFRGITDALLLLWLFVFLYVWPLLSRFDNTWQRTMIHALLMSIRHLPYTLGMIAADVLLVVGSYFLILFYANVYAGIFCFRLPSDCLDEFRLFLSGFSDSMKRRWK